MPAFPAKCPHNWWKLQRLPAEKLRAIEEDFARITELSTRKGRETLLREAGFKGLDFGRIFAAAQSHQECACWAFLNHPDIFALAAQFEQMHSFATGRWKRRFVGRNLNPRTSADDLEQLATMMRCSYAKEGRGRHCHIDHYVRQDPLRHCFFAYPEDHASTDLAYNAEGELQRQTRRASFEVVFVYRPEEGVLEVLAPGGAERVEDLSSCFTASILDLPELPPRMVPNAYDLSVLKSPDLRLPVDPEDKIRSVEVRSVVLHLARGHGWRPSLHLDQDSRPYCSASIHDMIQMTLNAQRTSPLNVSVARARIRVLFETPDSHRPTPVSFTIATPDYCTLRDSSHDNIVRKYLQRWGFVADQLNTRIAG